MFLAATAFATALFAGTAALDDVPNAWLPPILGPAFGLVLSLTTVRARRRNVRITGMDPVATQRAYRALRRGGVPTDPEEAEAAARLLPELRGAAGRATWVGLDVLLVVALAAVAVAALLHSWLVVVVAGPALIAGHLALRSETKALRTRYDRAERLLRTTDDTDR